VAEFLDLGSQPLCNEFVSPAEVDGERRYPLRLGFCPVCSLVQQVAPVPGVEMFSEHTYLTGTTAALVEHYHQLAGELEADLLGSGDLVVDIGSNDGSLLLGFSPDVRRLGIEPCSSIADRAVARGIETDVAFFGRAHAEDVVERLGRAKLVTAAGVWFHLDDLHDATDGVAALLDDDGVFVVQAMYLGEVLRNDAYDSFYHEHICLYSFRPLQRLLRDHGLEVFRVEQEAIHGGSMTCYSAPIGRRPVERSVHDLVERELEDGLDRIDTYLEFARRVEVKSKALRAMLEEARADGRTVWAYGAPAKSATLLNVAGIGPGLVSQALEVNPLKVGKLTPGTHIPVVLESPDLGTVDDVLLLSWNFRAALEPQIRGYLRPGGRILVPVPEPTWL
jgi:hypothetical protein